MIIIYIALLIANTYFAFADKRNGKLSKTVFMSAFAAGMMTCVILTEISN